MQYFLFKKILINDKIKMVLVWGSVTNKDVKCFTYAHSNDSLFLLRLCMGLCS